MSNRLKRILTGVLLMGAVSAIAISVVASWVWNNTMDTDTYVSNASLVIEQTEVQAHVADTISASIIGNQQVPEPISTALYEGARIIVSSSSFQTFWEMAHRTLHEQFRQYVFTDDAEGFVARIDLSGEVQAVMDQIASLQPQIAAILPLVAPETVIEVADTETLSDVKNAVTGLDRLKSTMPWIAVVLLGLAALLQGFRRTSLRLVSYTLLFTAPVVYAVGYMISFVAQQFIDGDFDTSVKVVVTEMTTTFATRAWQCVFVAIALLAATFIPLSRLTRARNDES